MEYAKDEIFNIRYREDINRLEVTKNRTNRILNLIKKNKFIMVLVTLAISISFINTLFIANFFKILFDMC